jgi:hypothetical protein
MVSRTVLLNVQPWRFQPGDAAYVRGWSQDHPTTVREHLHTGGGPHYLLEDHLGGQWKVSQLELSSCPIPAKDGRK